MKVLIMQLIYVTSVLNLTCIITGHPHAQLVRYSCDRLWLFSKGIHTAGRHLFIKMLLRFQFAVISKCTAVAKLAYKSIGFKTDWPTSK